jgi:hypothetical protein
MSSSTITINAGGSGSGVTANKNLLINGNFNIWQRGTTTVATTTKTNSTSYCADRFYVLPVGASVTYSRDILIPANNLTTYSAKITGATSVTTVKFAQRLEAIDVTTGMKQMLTFSAWIYNNTGAAITPTLIINTPSAVDNWSTNSTVLTQALSSISNASWSQVSYSFNPSAYSNINNGMEVTIQFPSGSLASGTQSVNITQCQLEVGGVVTTFERRTFAEELSLAQRYYAKTYNYGTAPGSISANGELYQLVVTLADNIQVPWRYPVAMRVTPTVTGYSPSTGIVNKASSSKGGDTDFYILVTGDAGVTFEIYTYIIYERMKLHAIADAEL